jgi:hypothetical protein
MVIHMHIPLHVVRGCTMDRRGKYDAHNAWPGSYEARRAPRAGINGDAVMAKMG